MDFSSLLFLLLICGCGNRSNNHCHSHCHNHCNNNCSGQNTSANQNNDDWECKVTCVRTEDEEKDNSCPCKDNGGMIPPPWVRVSDGRDNSSCGCNKR